MKISILVKIDENLDFGQNYRKFRIRSIFMKISILVRVYETFGFGQNGRKILIFEKSQFWIKVSKIFDLVKTYQNLDLDNIAENVDYSENFRKMSIWFKICKYPEFVQNFGLNSPKWRFWS